MRKFNNLIEALRKADMAKLEKTGTAGTIKVDGQKVKTLVNKTKNGFDVYIDDELIDTVKTEKLAQKIIKDFVKLAGLTG